MLTLDAVEAKAWSRVPDLVDAWVEKCAAPAWDIRQALRGLYTLADTGVYWHPDQEAAALMFRGDLSKVAQDATLISRAVARAVGGDHLYSQPLFEEDVDQGWVKVAYSPTLRRAGELLNFFPGNYPGGYPNSPSPLAATLTGGLVGAGLGYGLGWLGERLMPDTWAKGRTRRTLAALGGLLGAVPGTAWGYSAMRRGKGLLDGSDLSPPAGSRPEMSPVDMIGESPFKEASDKLAEIPLSPRYVEAADAFIKRAFSTFNTTNAPMMDATVIGVNVNKMGHTLWEVGADPQTAATTMGALYAAQQMPDHTARPGLVTPHQTGLLGTMMGAAGRGWLMEG